MRNEARFLVVVVVVTAHQNEEYKHDLARLSVGGYVPITHLCGSRVKQHDASMVCSMQAVRIHCERQRICTADMLHAVDKRTVVMLTLMK